MKQLRMERGRSQEALAHAAGVDLAYVSGIERLVRNPTITMLERIALALDVPAGHLLDPPEP